MIEKEFFTWMKRSGGVLVGEPVWGRRHRFIANRIYHRGQDFWAQLSRHPSREAADLFIERMCAKDNLPIQAPRTVEISRWDEYHVVHIMDFIKSEPISSGCVLGAYAHLSSCFFKDLAQMLHGLNNTSCPFVSYRQNVITRRIREHYNISPSLSIHSWGTIHGCLQWSRITHNNTFLGWQKWGCGPKDMDVAFLYVCGLKNSNACQEIENYFPSLLNSRDGFICLLFSCTEVLRMMKYYDEVDSEMCAQITTLSLNIFQRLQSKFVS